VETAFISNPAEEVRLKDASHQERLAEAVFAGVRTYFYASPPPGTRIAQLRQESDASRIAAAGEGAAAASGTSH
jgi:N-acetylmuramoyl-L-alanine amidase